MKIKLNINGKDYEAEVKDEDVKSIEGKKGRWRASGDEEYWYINSVGCTFPSTDNRDDVDNWSYLTGNYFRTNEEAKAYKSFLQAVGEIKAYIAENGVSFEVDWADIRQEKYFIYFDNIAGEFATAPWYSTHVPTLLPVLATTTHCEAVIRDCKKQLEIIRDYTIKNNY